VHVCFRSSTADDLSFVKKILSAVGLEEQAEIHDLSSKDIDALPKNINKLIAFGKVTARLANEYAKTIFELPGLENLRLFEKNKKHRKEAWEQLQKIKKEVDNTQDDDITDSNWRYSIIDLPGQKKICVFETQKPSHIQADIFISKEDSHLLLKMKEAFKAESVIIQGEERDEENV
jgi:ribosomal protein S13